MNSQKPQEQAPPPASETLHSTFLSDDPKPQRFNKRKPYKALYMSQLSLLRASSRCLQNMAPPTSQQRMTSLPGHPRNDNRNGCRSQATEQKRKVCTTKLKSKMVRKLTVLYTRLRLLAEAITHLHSCLVGLHAILCQLDFC